MDPPSGPPPSLLASFTGSLETRICGRDACRRTYDSCSQDEKLTWKRILNSRNSAGDSFRWFCGDCVKYYRGKDSTHVRDDIIHLPPTPPHPTPPHPTPPHLSSSPFIAQDDIRRNIASAQRGQGHRTKVHAVSPAASSTARITSRGNTYDSNRHAQAVQAGGYSHNHAKFLDENERWARKASGDVSQHRTGKASVGSTTASATPDTIRHTIPIKAFMGVVLSGRNTISQVGDCLEGLDEVDAHIGGDELHRICYELLQDKWLAWTRGYHVRFEDTTLRAKRVHAAIAGKGLTRPPKPSDAIWNLVFRERGKSSKRTFKVEEVILAVVVEQQDHENAEEHRNKHLPPPPPPPPLPHNEDDGASSRLSTPAIGTLDLCDPSEDESDGSTQVGNKRSTSKRPARPTSPNTSTSLGRKRPAAFVPPDEEAISSSLSAQTRVPDPQRFVSFFLDNTFRCRFYELPVAEYISDDLPEDILDLDDEDIDIHSGTLEVDFKCDAGQGRFKTAHPGRVKLDGGDADLPPFTNKTVCVKQIYRQRSNGCISRLPGRYELGAFFMECNRVRWASILLDMVYQFVEHEIIRRGKPNDPIPKLRYTRSMVAIVQGIANEKAYLVEEWIHTDEGDGDCQFYKYINNRYPTSA